MNIARVKIGKIRIKARSRSMINVVELAWPANEDVIEIADGLASRARDGIVDSIAIAATNRDGSITTAFHCGRKLFPLIGAVAAVEHRLRQKIET